MRARIEADEGVSSTTDAGIEELIRKADFLRGQYGVSTGFQQAPFFQVQTPAFALLAVDTGVLRRVDREELTWLRAALEASRGKMVMAVLGHPFFAGGHDVSAGDERVHGGAQSPARIRRAHRHGRGHARPRVLPRGRARARPARRPCITS